MNARENAGLSDSPPIAVETSPHTRGRLAGALGALLAPLSAPLDPLLGVACGLPLPSAATSLPPRCNAIRRRRRGLAIVLSGIEGASYATRWMAYGLLRARWRGAVTLHGWGDDTPVLRILPNLMNARRNEARARELLEVIRAYRREQPGRPVVLVAQSGGCWIIVRALELAAAAAEEVPAAAMRANATEPGPLVDTALLLTPAIARTRDLSAAAAMCRRMVVTRSCGDWLFLGLAVSLLGTMDRRHGPAGGWLGWSAQLSRGVQQVAWRPAWLRCGWLGNHTTAAVPATVRSLAGVLLAEVRQQTSDKETKRRRDGETK